MSVLIVSNDTDSSTNKVFAYLVKNTDVILLREDLHFLSDLIFEEEDSRNVNHVWFRREPRYSKKHKFKQSSYELYKLNEYIKLYLEKHYNCIGSIIVEERINKLMTLNEAENCGLRTPAFQLVRGKGIDVFNSGITKPIGNFFDLVWENYLYYNRSNSLINSDLKESSFPSLIQEYIDKKIEIRTYFIANLFYSMAIFSQKNEKTKVDFKDYDKNKPNRLVPFKLPNNIISKLKKLMTKLNLNSGSIDMIYSTKNEYVFLEVNPLGQFDWLSYNCNYYIERKLANMLSNEK